MPSPHSPDVPVVVFTGKDLNDEEIARLKLLAKSIVLKDVQSPERLLDETALFLHRIVTDLPPEKQAMLERLHGGSEVLRGRKVLIVDDDARNIFALTSVLENHDMEVISTTNGRQAIEILERTPELSIVLMDIMMPDMDGYATMREIRHVPKFRIAAHPGVDREGHERRSRKMPRCGRQRLYRQAREHRPVALAHAGLVVSMSAAASAASEEKVMNTEHLPRRR